MGREAALRVLIVDGAVDAGREFAWLLRGRGVDAVPVRTGAEALAAVDDFRPHAVLLEANLPDTTGYDLAPALAGASRCDLWVAIVSDVADPARCAAAGIRHVFPKPPDLQALGVALAGERYRRACLAEWPNREPGGGG